MNNLLKRMYNAIEIFVSIIFSLCISSCSIQAEKEAYDVVKCYGKINADLIDIFKEYEKDNKATAAYFILANSPANFAFNSNNISISQCNDASVLNCDSLIKDIDYSYKIWNEISREQTYSYDIFKEYILPYRIANEPLEYYWKQDVKSRMKVYPKKNASLETSINAINNSLGFTVDSKLSNVNFQSYSEMISSKIGTCDDRAILAAMALRAFGIPAALEFVPYWGDTNNGHSFTTAILPDNSIYPLDGTNNVGHNFTFVHKATKVYRKMYSIQKNTILFKNRNKEDIPYPFTDLTLLDVTNQHSIGFADLKLTVPETISSKIIYLCVFTINGWQPVAYAENRGKATIFTNIGIGINKGRDRQSYGCNYGEGILYLPCIYKDRHFIPISNPIIHSSDSSLYVSLTKNNTEKVILTRKYPLANRIAQFAEQMVGGVFQGANRADFSDAEVLHEIISTPASHMQKISINDKRKYKYFRYIKPSGAFSVGEIKLYDKNNNQIFGERVQADFFDDIPEVDQIFDGNALTYFSIDKLFDAWVGLRFSRPRHINTIEYSPRTDDNDIAPGDMYELFYWDDSWVSLGEKRATDYSITFDEVPKHALLWLRNKTKGLEERPFTYDGKQIWW